MAQDKPGAMGEREAFVNTTCPQPGNPYFTGAGNARGRGIEDARRIVGAVQ
jgi:hypothetical protein